MIVSNRDAFFMKTGQSKIDSMDYSTSMISIMAGGQVDAPNLGIINQDGDSYFENFFAIKPYSGSYNPVSSMKFSLEHQNPLVCGKILPGVKKYGNTGSLITTSDPNVLVWVVKPAEEGIDKGLIVRLWNLSNKDSECTIFSEKQIVGCTQTTHIEKDLEPIKTVNGKISIVIGHNRIQTYRIFLK
jgi:alpha-mannosidase